MRLFYITGVFLMMSASVALADSLLLASGGSINCQIIGLTDEHYIILADNKNCKIEKNNVVYTINSIETQTASAAKKANVLPYIYPYQNSFEIGICLIF